MGRHSSEFFGESIRFFFNPKDKELNPMYLEQKEELINRLDSNITDYLVKLSASKNMTEEQSNYASTLLQAVNDFERIGDHATNITESTIFSMENKVTFSEEALASIRQIADLTDETLKMALEALQTGNHSLARQVIKNEVVIDNLEKEFRFGHIMRLNDGMCNGSEGSIFLDMLSNIERVGDHAVNIAEYVLGKMGTLERQEVKITSKKIAFGENKF
ncbi:hypothetical protein N752_26950 [Desulforamulus aquiferis]|nr:PhoU domain-containing protein [Desulforamulus aquiferis]RYD02091.1 hypothetical protein N752_26950 [Desulforamulus aquiferis]